MVTITVQNTNDSGPGSLRDAIVNANLNPGSCIAFNMTTPATITLTSGDLEITNDMTITGPGADMMTVERSTAAGTPEFRIFTISSGTVTISGADGDERARP